MKLSSRLGAEFLGTFLLVFGGTGAAVLAAEYVNPVSSEATGLGIGFLGVALAFGLTVVAGAYALGPISGGHFNPAISIGLAAAKRFAWKDVAPYVVVQVVAAICASATLWLVAINREGATQDTPDGRRLRGQRLRRPLTRALRAHRRPADRGRS